MAKARPELGKRTLPRIPRPLRGSRRGCPRYQPHTVRDGRVGVAPTAPGRGMRGRRTPVAVGHGVVGAIEGQFPTSYPQGFGRGPGGVPRGPPNRHGRTGGFNPGGSASVRGSPLGASARQNGYGTVDEGGAGLGRLDPAQGALARDGPIHGGGWTGRPSAGAHLLAAKPAGSVHHSTPCVGGGRGSSVSRDGALRGVRRNDRPPYATHGKEVRRENLRENWSSQGPCGAWKHQEGPAG